MCAAQGVLSKLSAAKDMMKEMLDRERRKRAEREAEKQDAGSKAKEPAENVVTSQAGRPGKHSAQHVQGIIPESRLHAAVSPRTPDLCE